MVSDTVSIETNFAVLTKHATQCIGNLAHRGMRLNGGDDGRDQVVG